MKEVIVYEGPRTEIVETAIPEPAADQVSIKVEVAGCNPKDWKTWWVPTPINQGNDIAGIIHSLGQNVVGFKVN
jgi:NADPH2:quinone reductase